MRVLFVILPSKAHLYVPVVPLAWALQSAGHEVRFAVQPEMVDAVSRAGLHSVSFDEDRFVENRLDLDMSTADLDRLIGDLNISTRCRPGDSWEEPWLHLVNVMHVHAPYVDELVELCRQWKPDLVVWDPLCVAASVAARSCGAAHMRLLWGQDNLAWLWQEYGKRSASECSELVNGSLDWLMEPMLRRYGMRFEPELLFGNWTIDPMPLPLRIPLDFDIDYHSMRWVPYNGSSEVADWLRTEPERPRVCLTLGVGGRGRLLFKESGYSVGDVVRALAELDIELVVTLKEAQDALSGAVPDNVRIVDFVPLNQLLPTCAAVIHQGGSGTAMAAGAQRVPQLICPMAIWDEDNIADHVAEQGAGIVVQPAELTPQVLREQLTRLLAEPRFAEGAAAFHDDLQRAPSPIEIVPVIEKLTARHRASRVNGGSSWG